MWKSLLLLPFLLCGQAPLEPSSMLHQADWLARKYRGEVVKIPPPLPSPQPESCLDLAGTWFSLDLEEITPPALATLNDELLWDLLRELGVEGVYLKGLKQGGAHRTGLGVDPKWGTNWADLALTLQKKGMALISDSLGQSTGLSADFRLALQNIGDYPSLYHLIEIAEKDWPLLPQMSASSSSVNIPWLKLEQLLKKGYVPEQFSAYVKESHWNATSSIQCPDGKTRRWIYLKEGEKDPVIDWLSPSFAGEKIAAADLLDSRYHLGVNIVCLPSTLTPYAQKTLSLWARKLGLFSVLSGGKGLDEMKEKETDFVADTITRPALLHALLAGDTEALKMMYRLFLEEGIKLKRCVHILQPFDEFSCEWTELLLHPQRKYDYHDEILTGETLHSRLIKQDLFRLSGSSPSTWPGYCVKALNREDFDKDREEITKMHLLLAFFYAMQPGIFAFSASDLLGTVGVHPINLMEGTEGTLYASLPGQMRNRKSFAAQLKSINAVRRDSGIKSAELIAVPRTQHTGLILLIHQLEGGELQLLAVNFGKTPVAHTVEMPSFCQTTAIDLMTGLAERKPFSASTLSLTLPPLSGKVILFQKKYLE